MASGSHALHGWQASPFTGIAMMKLPAGLDDECVGALLILFASKMEMCFLSTTPFFLDTSRRLAKCGRDVVSMGHTCATVGIQLCLPAPLLSSSSSTDRRSQKKQPTKLRDQPLRTSQHHVLRTAIQHWRVYDSALVHWRVGRGPLWAHVCNRRTCTTPLCLKILTCPNWEQHEEKSPTLTASQNERSFNFVSLSQNPSSTTVQHCAKLPLDPASFS